MAGNLEGGSGWGVFMYKSVSDLNVTIVQPRDMNFMANFFIARFARIKDYPLSF